MVQLDEAELTLNPFPPVVSCAAHLVRYPDRGDLLSRVILPAQGFGVLPEGHEFHQLAGAGPIRIGHRQLHLGHDLPLLRRVGPDFAQAAAVALAFGLRLGVHRFCGGGGGEYRPFVWERGGRRRCAWLGLGHGAHDGVWGRNRRRVLLKEDVTRGPDGEQKVLGGVKDDPIGCDLGLTAGNRHLRVGHGDPDDLGIELETGLALGPEGQDDPVSQVPIDAVFRCCLQSGLQRGDSQVVRPRGFRSGRCARRVRCIFSHRI